MRTAPMLAVCLAVSAATPASAEVPAGGGAGLEFDTFHGVLAPYGEWVLLAPYGEVWRPVGMTPDWRPYFDGYWTEGDRYPFLILVNGSPAGFALVFFDEEGSANMAEFFVLRGQRHRGVGSVAAKQLIDKFRGKWEIREEPTNFGAQGFWRRVIQEYTNGDFEDLMLDDDHWQGPVQRFDSRVNAASASRSPGEA